MKFSKQNVWWNRFFLIVLLSNLAVTGRSEIITVTNTASTGAGSLNNAILTANANPGRDSIVFQISGAPPFTITLTNVLPAISDSVIIDATTQPGFAGKPVIELKGFAGGLNAGLRFSLGSDFSTLRGLALNHFPIQIIELDSASNSIQGNFIGTDITGTAARGGGSGSHGILVKSAGNLIGGTNSGDGNLISGNNDAGVYLLNANNNCVQGNLIGVTASGATSLSNLNSGIVIYGSSGNLIGGPVSTACNVVSGNGGSGVYLYGATAIGNVILGNRIGTDISGSNSVGNVVGDGVTVFASSGNAISGNLISGNGLTGVSISGAGASGNKLTGNLIGTDVNGKISLANHYAGVMISAAGANQLGGTNAGDGNVISGNLQDGIELTGGTTANLIQGNFIGVSAAGTSALHNGQNGISISGSSSNIIGGVAASARNVISGNAFNGVGILQLKDSGNIMLGNYIGTDVTGTKAVANSLSGVRIQAIGNVIGGSASGSGNVISGNGAQGVWLVGTNGNVTGNAIQGNLIGLDATGTSSLANGDDGVGISGGSSNQIGGSTANARNVISGNVGSGISLVGNGTTNNSVQGNYIGTDSSGALARGNVLGGIYLEQATANQIGGVFSGAGNLVSGNSARGIYLYSASSGNLIQGNDIGTQADGVTGLGNVYHGIDIDAGSLNNIIGGSATGAGNTIAFAKSPYCGVRVRTGAYNNLISGNSIFSNGALGIDLSPAIGGTVAGINLIMDCESGVAANAANQGQNFPILSDVYVSTGTRIRGTMDGKIGKTYTLQFFASPVANALGYGEGQYFLGQTNLTLTSACSANFTFFLPTIVSPGWVVSATATDISANNTSEFSDAQPVIAIPPIQLSPSGPNQLSLSWTNNGGNFVLEETYSLTPPVNWFPVLNLPILLNHFLITTLQQTNDSAFYRLVVP